MKQCRDINALRAFSRLRAAEFSSLTTYLRESLEVELEALKLARTMDEVCRRQGSIDAIEQVLKYVEDGESLAKQYSTPSRPVRG
ncbi:hypothetical protein [Paraburkholderia unamae]|uniref:Uncharacterized protein n=1 Tax=Paraburkholderia unamae TaxID=219649 RepID=A0ACC6RGQ1_9BURK